MIIIGLTGGIGSGKTTISRQFLKLRVPVFDSDKEVKKMYLSLDRELLSSIKKIDPKFSTMIRGKIDTQKLGDVVFNDIKKIKILEKTIFKKLKKLRKFFIDKNKKLGTKIVVLDTPLLFENKIDRGCDFIVTTKAPLRLRINRVLRRRGMSIKKIKKIIAKQLPEHIKQKRSDFVVQTNKGKCYSYNQIIKILQKIS